MAMKLPRGHSNVREYDTRPWRDCDDKACVPIRGGGTFNSVRDLPPLALSRGEWLEIGKRMGWVAESDLDKLANAAREDHAAGKALWDYLTERGLVEPSVPHLAVRRDSLFLYQFECRRCAAFFYYQSGWSDDHQLSFIIDRCPNCGSRRVRLTGRQYHALDEHYETKGGA